LTKKKKVFLQYLPTASNIKIKITTDASTAEFSGTKTLNNFKTHCSPDEQSQALVSPLYYTNTL
jgi:hypothetical protein